MNMLSDVMVAEQFLLGVGVCLLFLGVAVHFLLFLTMKGG
jgi:hypothetical protein